MSKRLLFLSMLITACQTPGSPREPAASNAGKLSPTEYVRYHSERFERNEVRRKLLTALNGKRLALLGEMHGTVEMPEYASAIVREAAKKYERIWVGFEFPQEVAKPVERFLASGDVRILKDTKFFGDMNYHSGRGSEAMVQFLSDLRGLPNVQVFCFDTNGGKSGEARDTAMARAILKVVEQAPAAIKRAPKPEAPLRKGEQKIQEPLIFAFTGNIHSRLTPGFPGQEKFATMGSEILRLSNGALNTGNVISFLFRYEQGSAWQCQTDERQRVDCGVKQMGPVRDVYSLANDDHRYFLLERELADGHSATIFIRNVSASSPLR